MDTSASMETDENTVPAPPVRMAWELPEEHLFRLVYRAYDTSVVTVHNNFNAAFDDFTQAGRLGCRRFSTRLSSILLDDFLSTPIVVL